MPPDSTIADRLLEGDRAVAAAARRLPLEAAPRQPRRAALGRRNWRFKRAHSGGESSGRPYRRVVRDLGRRRRRRGASASERARARRRLHDHAARAVGRARRRAARRRVRAAPRPAFSVAAEAPRRRRAPVRASASAGQHGGLRHRGRRARRDDSPRFRRRRGRRRSGPPSSRAAGAISSGCSSCSARTRPTSCRRCCKPWLARRAARPAELERRCARGCADASAWSEVEARLAALRETYWAVLDSLNAIPVKAGDVDLQRESGARSRPRAASRRRRKCTRSVIPRAAACSRSRSAARARRFERGTTCVFRCVTSTSKGRSRR